MHLINNAGQGIPVRGGPGALGRSRFLEEVTDPFGKHARVPFPTIGGVTPVSAHRPLLLNARLLLSQASPHLTFCLVFTRLSLHLHLSAWPVCMAVRACVGVGMWGSVLEHTRVLTCHAP
jgi:hypothetical protein